MKYKYPVSINIMLNKMIQDMTKHNDKINKVFVGAYVENNIAHITNGKLAFVLPANLEKGYYASTNERISDDIIKIDKAINGNKALTATIYKNIKPTEYFMETVKINTRDLLKAIDWSQKKLIPEQLLKLTNGLTKKEITQLNVAAKPSKIIHFTIKERKLYLNDVLFSPTQYLVSDIDSRDLDFYIDSDYLKMVAKYSKELVIKYSGYNRPITFIDDKFVALIMPCIPGKTKLQFYLKNGRNYCEVELSCIKLLLKKEYDEILEMLEDCYYMPAIKKSNTQIYNVIKSFPDIFTIKDELRNKKNNYITTTIENKFMFTTNGVCLTKLNTEMTDGSYINENVLDKFKPLETINTLALKIRPINQEALNQVKPANKNINSTIEISKDNFLKYINRTKFKIDGLKSSQYIEFKIKDNNFYINDILISQTNHAEDLILYFDNRYFDLVKYFENYITIKIYNDSTIIKSYHNALVISDRKDNEMILMPMSYSKTEVEELYKNYIFINGIRIDNRDVVKYCEDNIISVDSAKEMLLNNSFKK